MKKFFILFITLLLIINLSSFAETIEENVQEVNDVLLGDTTDSPTEEEYFESESQYDIVEYDYIVNLNNLSLYNIVALNNANITQHIRGSIWIGGTLTGSQYIDDGSINGQAASDSYVYINNSDIFFKGRTANQSKDYYFLLTANSVDQTRNFWIDLMEDLPNGNTTFTYLPPDKNGYVDARLWEYKASGSDETKETIEHVYWSNATHIDVGGLAGHLIAPYADINIVSSNNRGSIVGWNININGETHINYYTPTRPKPEDKITPSPTPPAKISITKTIVGEMWHVRCDIMDTVTFMSGGGKWKGDVISNPSNITSREGHRSNHCGSDDNWVIWADTNGVPYRMDEIHSGATGGPLPTVVYRPRYALTTEEIQGMTSKNTELVYKYSQNFIDPMPWSEIKIGERLYWTTTNGNSIWYHSGIPYIAVPNFVLFVNGTSYPITAGETIEINDLKPGIYEIIESPDLKYYLGTVNVENATITETGEWSIKVEVDTGADVAIDWPNVVVTPQPTNSPTPPPTPKITPTPTPIPTPTPRTTPKIIRPTPLPIIPPTGEPEFIFSLIFLITGIIGIIIILWYNKKKK